MKVTEELADYIVNAGYELLPQEAVINAKRLVLDSLGVSFAGTVSPVGKIVLKIGRESRDGEGSSVIGGGFRTSVSSAAFVNGTLAHALDIDDTAAGTIAHPSASILPALWALTEKNNFSGKEFLTAYIMGLEVFYRLALASQGLMLGWHRSSVFGAIATAAAAGKLLKLSTEQLCAAVGLSSSLSSGLQVNFGTMTKAIQVGNASRSGVIAAQLAKDGCTANGDALGDPMGFGYAFYSGKFEPEKIVKDLGDPLSIIFPGIGMKIHPCCGLTHSAADIMIDLVHEHDILYPEVEKVEVYTEELVPSVLVHHEPKTGYEGKYSMEYVVAAVLFDRELTPDTFTDVSVNRPQIGELLKKVECGVHPDAQWVDMRLHAWNHPAHVIITLKSGRRYESKAPCAKGYPDLPLTEEEIITKFRNGMALALVEKRATRLIEMVLNLETITSTADLTRTVYDGALPE